MVRSFAPSSALSRTASDGLSLFRLCLVNCTLCPLINAVTYDKWKTSGFFLKPDIPQPTIALFRESAFHQRALFKRYAAYRVRASLVYSPFSRTIKVSQSRWYLCIVVVVEQKQADENPLLYEFEIKRYTRWQKDVDDDNVYGD